MRLPPSNARSSLRFVRVVTLAALLVALLATRSNAAAGSPLSCSPSRLAFGGVQVGQTLTLMVTVTNNGSNAVSISGISSSNSAYKIGSLKMPQTLNARQSLAINIAFSPKTKAYQSGTVTFASNASGPALRLTVGGAGVSAELISASPTSISFGQVKVGSSSTIPVTLTNPHAWAVKLNKMLVSGGSAFSVSGASFPLTLAGNKTVTLQFTFKPIAPGLTGGSALFSGAALDIPFTGTGSGSSSGQAQLSMSPSNINFGNVADGMTATALMSVTANGGTVTINSASSSNKAFALPAESFPITLNAGKSVTMQVTFTPANSGAASGALSFVSTATNSPASEGLAGTGTTPYVELSWAPSTSDVAGYNVYRTMTSGGSYTKINSGLVASTSFKDASVAIGQTYYYVTTAVTSSGQESGYSNQVKVPVE
jgi:Abnormal spindle-like microcephaly-assoc'd, ASPM-SPD-2-Hydin